MIRIVTDTASDITKAQAEKMNITLMPVAVTFGSEPYNQLEDEDFTKFYETQKNSSESSTTSLISPGEFLDIFEDAKKNNDSVIVIPMSSKLSGTFQSAELAKNMSEYDDIHILDARQITIGLRILVEHAVRLRDENKSIEEIAASVMDVAKRTRLYASLDTLKYLVKGGRISKTAGFMGTALNIKPVIRVEDGAILATGKGRGNAGANKLLLEYVGEKANFDPAFPFHFGYTGSREQLDVFAALAVEKFNLKNTKTYAIGGVIGTHTGPNAVAAVWVENP
jgi:DegV family protein with EDD domain